MGTASNRHVGVLLAIAAAHAAPHAAAAQVPPGYVSAAARADWRGACRTGAYPPPTPWGADFARQARAATPQDHLTPRVELWRRGRKFASLPGLGGVYNANEPNQSAEPDYLARTGALGRRSYRALLPGDIIKVFPAVYSLADPMNAVFLGGGVDTYAQYLAVGRKVGSLPAPVDPSVARLPVADGTYAGFVPTDITIQGVEEHGIRPVLYDPPNGGFGSNLDAAAVDITAGDGVTWSNIDVVADPNYGGARAGLFAYGVRNLTVRDSRFLGWGPNARTTGSMGIFTGEGGPMGLSGTLTLSHVEVGFSGGQESSYAHNLYIGSGTDARLRMVVRGLWSHDSFGHELKVRAPYLDLQGSYLQGGGHDIAALDFSNGGTLIVRDTIFSRVAPQHYDGTNNGGFINYDFEGAPGQNPQPDQAARRDTVDIENNTFVARSPFYRTADGAAPFYPMGFFWPMAPPPPGTVRDNVFVGFCPNRSALVDFRGADAATLGLAEIDPSYRLTDPLAGAASPAGWPDYAHQAGTGVRRTATVGARD
jgi:hypothetical protein